MFSLIEKDLFKKFKLEGVNKFNVQETKEKILCFNWKEFTEHNLTTILKFENKFSPCQEMLCDIFKQLNKPKNRNLKYHNYTTSDIKSVDELKNLLYKYDIDDNKFRNSIHELYNEINKGEAILYEGVDKKELLRAVNVVQLILIDFDTKHFLVEE